MAVRIIFHQPPGPWMLVAKGRTLHLFFFHEDSGEWEACGITGEPLNPEGAL